MKIVFISIGIVLLIFCIFFIFGVEIKRKYNFKQHKKRVNRTLYSLAKNCDAFLISNYEIPYEVTKISFDQLYFGKKYIYCIRTFTGEFGVEGNAKDKKWLNYNKAKSFDSIDNVLLINNENVNLLKKYLNINDDKMFVSIVVVNNECDLAITNEDEMEKVLKLEKLKRFILTKEKDKSIKAINQEKLEITVKILYNKMQQALEER